MSLNFKIIPQPSYIRCEVTGIHDDTQEVIDNFTQLLGVCRDRCCSKILYDLRNAINLPNHSAIERTLITNKMIEITANVPQLWGEKY